jgi:molecular chaperone GrpE (heat shock protein)
MVRINQKRQGNMINTNKNSSSKKLEELATENKQLQKENIKLNAELSNLRLSLVKRIEALEGDTVTRTNKDLCRMNGDCYR